MDPFTTARLSMVADQIQRRGLREPRLLDVLRDVPRHRFVAERLWDDAYSDFPLPVGHWQTISQPFIVALMTDLLCLKGDERVLEVGTGSGYQAAVLSRMAKEVITIELIPDLAEQARRVLRELNYTNITVLTGDGSLGWSSGAPYDGILVTAASPQVPPELLEQLSPRGKLVAPVGFRDGQELQVWERAGNGFVHESSIPVAFVPLRGKFGWKEEEWQR